MKILALLLLLIPSLAAGQLIDGPDNVPVGRLVRLQAEGVLAGSWLVLPPTPNFEPVGRRAFFSGEEPGVWTFAIVDAEAKVLAWKMVTVSGDGPEPDPDPKPEPKPDPTPPLRGLTVIVVEESADRTPAQQAVLAGPWRTWCLQKMYVVRQVERDSPAPDAAPWIKGAARGRPFVYFVSDDKAIYEALPLPDTAAEMMALVKKWGAK